MDRHKACPDAEDQRRQTGASDIFTENMGKTKHDTLSTQARPQRQAESQDGAEPSHDGLPHVVVLPRTHRRTEEEKFIRGTVNVRLIFHTRGSVLRGLDVAVSHMSLGEKARIKVRSDYAFGGVFGARQVPPFSTLIFIAQIAAIGHYDAKTLLLRRAVRDVVDDGLFRLMTLVSNIVSCLACWGGRGVALLGTRIRASKRLATTGDIGEDLALALVD